MADGTIVHLHPPKTSANPNTGQQSGHGTVRDNFDGTEYGFHTPEDNNWTDIAEGDSVTFTKTNSFITNPHNGEQITNTTISNITVVAD